MRALDIVAGAPLAAALALASGCGFVVSSADFDDEVRALERRGIAAQPGQSFHIGSLLLSIARSAAGTEDAESDAVLSAVSSIDVGTFHLTGERQDLGLVVPCFAGHGWEPIVTLRSRTDHAQILVRESRGRLRGMMLAALDGDELTLVRLRGDLEPLLDAAVAGSLTSDSGPLSMARR